MHRTTRRSLVASLVALACFPAWVQAQQAQDDENQFVRAVAPDAIPAIDAPEFVSASEADRYFYGDEIVIGIVGESVQRAYSTWQLDRHEIVNDVFEGRPIAVTW